MKKKFKVLPPLKQFGDKKTFPEFWQLTYETSYVYLGLIKLWWDLLALITSLVEI